jgi:hypothetical protein
MSDNGDIPDLLAKGDALASPFSFRSAARPVPIC